MRLQAHRKIVRKHAAKQSFYRTSYYKISQPFKRLSFCTCPFYCTGAACGRSNMEGKITDG